jgi:restriction system protein
MGGIDWYQFEKLNKAILEGEGWQVKRPAGAKPDGGKDLIATRDGQSLFVQCKHWRTWKVQEKVVRELIGSMSIAGISSGAIHTLHGFTVGAQGLSSSTAIMLYDGSDLAARARAALSDHDLTRILATEPKFCPRCDSLMKQRTGGFESLWGCSTYPRCTGKILCAQTDPE